MGARTWNELAKDRDIPAKPQGRWTLVVEYVGDKKLLKIQVADTTQTWTYAPNGSCGADGDPATPLRLLSLLRDKAPVGALLGKIGGSTAGVDDGAVFLAGSFCLVRLAEGQEGPLFLTINDSPEGFEDNKGSLKVSVYESL